MISKALSINEVKVCKGPVEFVCHGLGSCIGLFVTDKLRNISGGAHIPLPPGEGNADMLGADELLSELMEGFQSLGSDLANLRAKVVGGARIVSTLASCGHNNTESVISFLRTHKVYIAATDTGGYISRTARFNSVTQELTIFTSELKTYAI